MKIRPGQSLYPVRDSMRNCFSFWNKLNYNADYWLESIETTNDEKILQWIEDVLFLIPLGPLKTDYYVLNNTNITAEGANSCRMQQKCAGKPFTTWILMRSANIFKILLRHKYLCFQTWLIMRYLK